MESFKRARRQGGSDGSGGSDRREGLRAEYGSEASWLLIPDTGESAPIPVTIRRDARRRTRLCLRVRPDGTVELFLPAWAGLEDARAALRKRAAWIARHVADARARPRPTPPRYTPGERHLYLGRLFPLDLLQVPPARQRNARAAPDKPPVRIERGRLTARLPAPTPEKARDALAAWYAAEAARLFKRRLEAIRAAVPWLTRVPSLRLRAMRSRWGSCSAEGMLTLNTHLIKAPRRCIDYVICHELAHLREMNHSPRFYVLLDQIMPDWRQVRARLNELAPLILPYEHDARGASPTGADSPPCRDLPAPGSAAPELSAQKLSPQDLSAP